VSLRAGTGVRTRRAYRLRVNPIACDAHGMCAELLPEHIVLDEWGYPIITDGGVQEDVLALARTAVNACPTRALLLQRRNFNDQS